MFEAIESNKTDLNAVADIHVLYYVMVPNHSLQSVCSRSGHHLARSIRFDLGKYFPVRT